MATSSLIAEKPVAAQAGRSTSARPSIACWNFFWSIRDGCSAASNCSTACGAAISISTSVRGMCISAVAQIAQPRPRAGSDPHRAPARLRPRRPFAKGGIGWRQIISAVVPATRDRYAVTYRSCEVTIAFRDQTLGHEAPVIKSCRLRAALGRPADSLRRLIGDPRSDVRNRAGCQRLAAAEEEFELEDRPIGQWQVRLTQASSSDSRWLIGTHIIRKRSDPVPSRFPKSVGQRGVAARDRT